MKIASNFWQFINNVKQSVFPILLCLGLLATVGMAKPAVHGANEGENSATPNITFEPSATFQRLWIDYNITEGGVKGMRIHTDFKVYNMKGIDGYLALYFQERDGTSLPDNNGEFNSANDTVALYREITPGFQTTVYEDYAVFMPYAELDLSPGSFKLRIDADVIYKEGGLVSHLTFYDFDYTQPRSTTTTTTSKNPSATFDNIWVDYNVTQSGRRGMLVHIKCNVFDMKGQSGYLGFYFQRKDGTKLYSTNRAYKSNNRQGQLALYFEITPGYDNTVYEDMTVFMPYDEITVSRGNHDLAIDIDLISKTEVLLQHIELKDFWFEKK